MSDWDKTKSKFRRIVAREGVSQVANEIPAARNTVYRIIKNETQEPARAVRAGVERVVANREKDHE